MSMLIFTFLERR